MINDVTSNDPVAEDVKYLQDTLYVIGGKWTLLVLLSLNNGNRRFRDIQRSIPGITTRMLSKELKALEANKLIVRNVSDDGAALVSYEVTWYCKSFDPIIKGMIEWGKGHRAYVMGKQNGPAQKNET